MEKRAVKQEKNESILVGLDIGNFTKSYFCHILVLKSKGVISNESAKIIWGTLLNEGAITELGALGLGSGKEVRYYTLTRRVEAYKSEKGDWLVVDIRQDKQ